MCLVPAAAAEHLLVPSTTSLFCRDAPQLAQLCLRGNPLTTSKAFTHSLTAALPLLDTLDGVKLRQTKQQQGRATGTSNSSTSSSRGCAAGGRGKEGGCVVWGGVTLWHSPTGPCAAGPGQDQGGWQSTAHSLVLTDKGLVNLKALTACSRLVSMDLSDNLLTSLEGLPPCSATLSELCLTGNLLTKVDPLTALVNLRRLDLGDNQFTSLACLSALTGLSQLSVEGNRVPALTGVEQLTGLMELYAAGNQLSNFRVSPSSASFHS